MCYEHYVKVFVLYCSKLKLYPHETHGRAKAHISSYFQSGGSRSRNLNVQFKGFSGGSNFLPSALASVHCIYSKSESFAHPTHPDLQAPLGLAPQEADSFGYT